MPKRKLLVIGLDCASPDIVFNKLKKKLPNLSFLIDNGLHGPLRSTMPPITIPAWMVMFTGKKPGKLGLYGFRHRSNHSYTDFWIANSTSVKEPKVWDIIGKKGKKSCIIAIPPSYPPPIINGWSVSCFLTPSTTKNYTYPATLKQELLDNIKEDYIPDIEIRTGDHKEISKQLFQMLENHMKIIKYLIKTKTWDFFAFVEIGVDRLHHAFWHYFDENHPFYEPNTEYQDIIEKYYILLDKHIGEILTLIDDDTYVMVTSDHGVKPMKGAFCINDWLIKEGLLTLKERPKKAIPLSKAKIDWSKTKAWGWGGYYSRIFLNVKDREEQGLITREEYPKEIKKLMTKLQSLTDHQGKIMNNIVIIPTDYYEITKGDYPDLMVIYDDLNWRASGTIGNDSLYIFENESASGDAMHDWKGIFVLYDPQRKIPLGKTKANIEDIAPTILYLLNEKIPTDLDGKVITNVKQR